MAIKPLKDRVAAHRVEAETATKSGILLGEAKDTPNTAIVDEVGAEVKTLKKGDKVLFKEYSATEVKIDGKDVLFIAEEDILATI
ncbi:MAG: co-chaperone GroES [Candidatus Nomurabacteria bacterium]|jgi:chaperonin GroES|nr:co-chaperone GroES [Candidatus Nomurabacteria bacterium]